MGRELKGRKTNADERVMRTTSMTVRQRVAGGLGLLSAMVLWVGIMGLWGMDRIGQRAGVLEQTHQCEILFAQVRNTERWAAGSESTDLAENVWKKAKDKFLSAVRKLSQNPALDDGERQVIQSIQKSWKEYDTSFRKTVIAGQTDRSSPAKPVHASADSVTNGLEELRKGAAERLDWTLLTMPRLLVVTVALAVAGGLMLGQVISRVLFLTVQRTLEGLRNAPNSDDLARQGETIRQAVENLTNLIGQTRRPEEAPDESDSSTSERGTNSRS